MKIMTFNVQHCEKYREDKIDYKAVADVIKACDADVVGLNEIFGEGTRFEEQTRILSELTGMKYYYFAQAKIFDCGPYGNAILSRIPILSAETIPVPDPEVKTGNEYYETRCLLKAKLENGITVIITHFGLNDDEHVNCAETVLANIEEKNCVLMGDFNMQPDNPVLKPIYEKMNDTAEFFDNKLLSFPSDKPRIKIDYIFASRDLVFENADIPDFTVSDHRPHTAEITV